MTIQSVQPVLVIHGGAGAILRERFPPERQSEYEAALRDSLAAGMDILAAGGSAVDAVEAAVMSMEDCPLFNCGKGSVFTRGGHVEMEACIVSGDTGESGSATLIHHVRNPIQLAKHIMLHTPHCFLGGEEAELFASQQRLPMESPDYFWTEPRWRQHIDDQDKEVITTTDDDSDDDDYVVVTVSDPDSVEGEAPKGTVGAVAMDSRGRLAAATSTGGRNNKWDGRIGDTPLLGAGSFAPPGNRCAISCTGHGEYFIQHGVAHDVYARVKYLGEDVLTASTTIVEELRAVQGAGGMIAIGADGQIAMPYNTSGMYRGYQRYGESPRTYIFEATD